MDTRFFPRLETPAIGARYRTIFTDGEWIVLDVGRNTGGFMMVKLRPDGNPDYRMSIPLDDFATSFELVAE